MSSDLTQISRKQPVTNYCWRYYRCLDSCWHRFSVQRLDGSGLLSSEVSVTFLPHNCMRNLDFYHWKSASSHFTASNFLFLFSIQSHILSFGRRGLERVRQRCWSCHLSCRPSPHGCCRTLTFTASYYYLRCRWRVRLTPQGEWFQQLGCFRSRPSPADNQAQWGKSSALRWRCHLSGAWALCLLSLFKFWQRPFLGLFLVSPC